MTPAEISSETARCLSSGDGTMRKNRQGKLHVRYAMVQAAVGYPTDSAPHTVLLLEDAGGYFDCSRRNAELWVGKGGDHFAVDRSAAGFELPTISGGTSNHCSSATAPTIDSAVALRTSSATAAARVSLRARGGTRTTTVPTRNGYVYLSTQVNGKAVTQSTTMTVELLDARGARLRIQPYAGQVTKQLTYVIDHC